MKTQENNKGFNLIKASVAFSLLATSILTSCTASGTVTPNPKPTATPSATATPTPGPTATPTAGPTATPMPTGEPTATPTATPVPTPTPTATPNTSPMTMYALNIGNQLLRFSSGSPSTVTTIPITGLPGGITMRGIDFRPTDNKLYGVTSGSRVYTIDTTTGAATATGVSFNPVLTSNLMGFDFNPVADRIRVQGKTVQNLRINPVNGAVSNTDPNLFYADGDANAGAIPALVGSAYTNSASGATSTELYAIDSSRDVLVKLSDPNTGGISTVGALNVNTDDPVGFDISGDGRAYAALRPSAGNNSVLYTINLQTGAATQLENIGSNQQIIGLAIAP